MTITTEQVLGKIQELADEDYAPVISSMQATIDTKNAAVAALEAEVTSLEAQVATLMASTADKDAIIATRDATIAGQTATIATRDATIADQTTTLAAKDATIAGQVSTIAARDATIASLNAQIVTLNNQIITLNGQIATLNAQVAALQAQIASGPQLLTVDLMLPGQTDKYLRAIDVADGAIVSSIQPKGRRANPPFLQSGAGLQPSKANGEVTFVGAQHVFTGNDKDVNLRQRWGMCYVWVDLTPTTGTTYIMSQNGYSGGSADRPYRQPCVEIVQATNVVKLTTFDKLGAPSISSTPIDCSNGKYVLIFWHRRGDRLYLRVDGVPMGSVATLPWLPNNVTSERCYIGYTGAANGTFKWRYSHFGDGELSDKDCEFLEGIWAWQLGDPVRNLPAGHRCKAAAPLVTDYRPEDKPVFYKWDAPSYNGWAAGLPGTVYAHRGEQTQAALIAGMKDAIVTDWDRADQFPAQPFAGAVNSPWFSTDTFVATQAAFFNPVNNSFYPEAYAQDLTNGGRLKLIMSRVGTTYRTGVIAMANAGGYGRRLRPGFYEVEFSFTAATAPLIGYFPGVPWFYGWTKWFLGSWNPVETDANEMTGRGASYVEGNSWVHNPDVPTTGLVGVTPIDVHTKIYANSMIAGTLPTVALPNGFPLTINIYDGQKHKMAFLKQRNGLCVWWFDGYELGRAPWHDHMADPMIAIIDHVLDYPGHGDRPLNDGEISELILEKWTHKLSDAEFDTVGAGFVARPQLLNIGGTLTVIPNCAESHVEYRWYQDAVPLPLLMGKTAPAAAGTWYVNVTNKALAGTPDANTLRVVI